MSKNFKMIQQETQLKPYVIQKLERNSLTYKERKNSIFIIDSWNKIDKKIQRNWLIRILKHTTGKEKLKESSIWQTYKSSVSKHKTNKWCKDFKNTLLKERLV
jgi:hypothetical protein